jgi:hypothetical protein
MMYKLFASLVFLAILGRVTLDYLHDKSFPRGLPPPTVEVSVQRPSVDGWHIVTVKQYKESQ